MFEQGVGGKFSAMRVKRRVAIVIAADTSVGRAVAATLARSGVAVVANYARHRAAAHQLVLDIHAQGGAALAVQASMTVKSQVKALFDATSEFFGRVDIVVLITDASRRSEPGTQDIVWRTDELHVLAEAAHRLPHSGRVVRIRVCPQLSTPDCLHDTWEVASGLAREFHPRSITINLTRRFT